MTARPRVLFVDDDVSLQRTVAVLLRSHGYEVEVAGNGAAALDAHVTRPADVVVLDLGLPDLDGTEVCRRLRAASSVPIIVLSARTAEADKVEVLDIGADDYVTKPFGPVELMARVRVALRRANDREERDVTRGGLVLAGPFVLDFDRRRVFRDGEEIRLTPKEFELFALLASRADRVLTHRAILKAIWGGNAVEQPEHLWTLVAQLRKKIEPDVANPRYLVSEPWVGYRFATGDPGSSD